MAEAAPENEVCVGIDLGTTYTCVAVFKKSGHVEVIANSYGSRTTPSYVAFSERETLIGEAAKNQAPMSPRNTIYDAKRLIGRKFNDTEVRKDLKHWAFQVVEDNGNPNIILDIPNERKSYLPEEISSIILSYMKDLATKYLGKEVKNAVITVPAYFNDAQRDATKTAGRLAGLEVMRIVNEPTAAGIAYGFRNNDIKKEKKTHILVFDLGGGTFDVSILAIQKGVYEVVATSGDSHLGGQDFDNNVVEYFIQEIKRKNDIDISKNDKAKIRLRTECERGKRYLATNSQTTIVVDTLQPGFDFKSTLSRTKFDDLNKKLYDKLKIPIKTALNDASLKAENIDDVVLIGGSSRIVAVKNIIEQMFPKKIRQDINNDEAVAFGAAVIAAYLNGEKHELLKDFILRDVTALSLGLEIKGGQMAFFIRRNKPLPQTETKWFSTNRDSQSSICFVVYEGERPLAQDNNRLGEFIVSGIETGKRDSVQIKVTLTINHNGILDVSAVESLTGLGKELQIQNVGRLSEVEVMKMVQDAIKFREDDQREKDRIDSRLALEEYCNNIIDCIDPENAAMDESNIILEKCQETLAWINDNHDVDAEDYEEKLQNLKNDCAPQMGKYFRNN